MTKRIYTDPSIASSEITPESVFLNRRAFIRASSGTAATALGLSSAALASAAEPVELSYQTDPDGSLRGEQTPYDAVTSYNNFY